MKIACAWMYAIGRFGFPPKIGDVFTAFREMRDMGFTYVEAEGIGYENLDQVIGERDEIKRALQGEGLRLADFAVLLPDVISMSTAVREKSFDYFKRGAETAALLGSPNIWIDSYLPPLEVRKGVVPTKDLVYGQEFRVSIPEGFSWERFWENFVSSVSELCAIAESFGLTFLIEPRVGEVISNSDAMIRLASIINNPNLGFILDVAHQHAQKELIPLVVEKMGGLIRYVHVADNDGRDNRHFEPGKGNVDWEEVMRVLKKRRYDGFFAIDLERLPDLRDAFLRSKLFLEDMAARYGL